MDLNKPFAGTNMLLMSFASGIYNLNARLEQEAQKDTSSEFQPRFDQN